jgi:uncharacterized protein YmfQ (DUF2313 family)
MRTAADYTGQLQALLPQGRAWPREPDTWLGRLLAALAEEFARVDGRAMNLLDEADPFTTLELLPEWERLAGLPDPCLPIADTTRERQLAVAAKIAGIGGQTPAFFIELAAKAGLEVVIEEFEPFVAGSGAGDELFDDPWRHVFLVRAVAPSEAIGEGFTLSLIDFTAGSSAGERLRNWGATNVECLIARARPAHSISLFGYDADPDPALWFEFTQ